MFHPQVVPQPAPELEPRNNGVTRKRKRTAKDVPPCKANKTFRQCPTPPPELDTIQHISEGAPLGNSLIPEELQPISPGSSPRPEKREPVAEPKPKPDPQGEVRKGLMQMDVPLGMIEAFMRPQSDSVYSHVREAIATGDHGDQSHRLFEYDIRKTALREWELKTYQHLGINPGDRPMSKEDREAEKRKHKNAKARAARYNRSLLFEEPLIELRSNTPKKLVKAKPAQEMPAQEQVVHEKAAQEEVAKKSAQQIEAGKHTPPNKQQATENKNNELESDLWAALQGVGSDDEESREEDEDSTLWGTATPPTEPMEEDEETEEEKAASLEALLLEAFAEKNEEKTSAKEQEPEKIDDDDDFDQAAFDAAESVDGEEDDPTSRGYFTLPTFDDDESDISEEE